MDVRIEKLVYGGEGLAHSEGHTVFVPLVLPGELVRIESTARKKKFIRGKLQRILEVSPERVAAPCPYFGRCGGCQYQHIPYDAQLRYKAEILRETLARIGKVQWDGPIGATPSPPLGYRNRAQWKLRTTATGSPDQPGIGYFEAASTRLCSISECPISSPLLNQVLARFGNLIGNGETFGGADEIEAFADAKDENLLLNISAARLTGEAERLAKTLRDAVPEARSILIQDRHADAFHLVGDGYLNYTVAGAGYRVGHLSFFQVNRFLLQPLLDAALGDERGRLALDLFAGVGLFTVALARRFERVIGVESNLAAARDLEVNLNESGAPSPKARHATAESFLARWHEQPDLVVLDPPRAGIEIEALSRLKKLAPAAIHYLSCDPATLGRDLAVLVGNQDAPGPYQIGSINLFDIFPQTYHMEVLVRLKRRA